MARKPKKTDYVPQSFESKGKKFTNQRGKPQEESFASLYESMLQSPVFKGLKPREKVLYLYCKAQQFGKRKPSKDYNGQFPEESSFYFNWGKALEYGLYPESSSRNFYRDMQTLEEKGFIEKLKSGQAHKEKNVYRFVDKWQKWG